MRRNERIRRLLRLVPWPSILLAAACGGGDKNPAGPGGGGDAVRYELASIGRVGLPADLQVEDCTPTRFYSGGLSLREDDTWKIGLEVSDIDGDWGYIDEGTLDEDEFAVWFESDISGSRYPAQVNGSEVKIMYDWCYDGENDIQLVFER